MSYLVTPMLWTSIADDLNSDCTVDVDCTLGCGVDWF